MSLDKLGLEGAVAPPKSPKLKLKQSTSSVKNTPLLGDAELTVKKAGTETASADQTAPAAPAAKKEDTKKKKLDDLDALLWDNALGETEKMGSDSKGEQRDGRKRHKKRARQHVGPTLQGIGKGAGLTPMKMGGHRTMDK